MKIVKKCNEDVATIPASSAVKGQVYKRLDKPSRYYLRLATPILRFANLQTGVTTSFDPSQALVHLPNAELVTNEE